MKFNSSRSIVDLKSAFLSDAVSPAQAVEDVLGRIEKSDFNAFIEVDRAGATLAAASATLVGQSGGSLGALHGIPIGVKDVIDVAGMKTTAGSGFLGAEAATADALAIRRLRAEGAIIVGKTNVHQFATGATGDISHFGPVLNPLDRTRVPGGSSSGSGAAVAAQLCPAAIGTDTGGSVRMPAALCGIVGMKPTYGLVPTEGVFPLARTLDHVGPMTATVEDNATLLEVLADRAGHYVSEMRRSPAGMRVGLLRGYFSNFVEPEIEATLQQACELLRKLEVDVVEIAVDEAEEAYHWMQTVLKAESAALHRKWLDGAKPYADDVRSRLIGNRNVSADDYLEALWSRPRARAIYDKALDGLDLLLSPTCGIFAPPQGERNTALQGNTHPTFWLLARMTGSFNFSGHPALSLPVMSTSGQSAGLQFIARHYDEASIYRVAAALSAELRNPS
ncbi:amidase [Bradyrhizobium sp. 187]|uniref:amidase n=1 Tax=Bradyrhizobium sp. 187 TaxID=2782655 RepID=UPI0020000481|nr:amidase [Bradyrhizobium sp. 187]UPJ76805.1 amidase [Bradyrhizobium sp. 187]